jgi:SAM-dependent methyltransferase
MGERRDGMVDERGEERATGDIAWDWVAELYDVYVTTTRDLPFYLAQSAGFTGDALELMCGTGRVSVPLAEAGVRLTCVDASVGMLARLREKLAQRPAAANNIIVIQSDVRDLALDRQFDLILLPFHSFSELTAKEDQRRVLASVARLLREGGRFICPLHNPSVRRATLDGLPRLVGRFPFGAGQLHVWSVASYDPITQIAEGAQFYEEYDSAGTMLRKRQLPIRFALHDHDRFEAMARDAGLRVQALYGDYASAPFDPETSPFQVWVLAR